MPEAANMLGISISLLRSWVQKAGLREQVQKQRLDYDMRVFYLTQAQIEQIATLHGRQIATLATIDPLARLEAVDAALTERIEALEARVAALEGKQGDVNQS